MPGLFNGTGLELESRSGSSWRIIPSLREWNEVV